MAEHRFSTRLGSISPEQFQAALDHFGLGRFVDAQSIPFGLFGQNVFVTGSAGEFVLRGAAHYDWQFPKEQFVASLLHEQTAVPVPWPYLVSSDESIFGWPYGFAMMPRMPGLQLADPAIIRAIPPSDRQAIARVLGVTLREVQRVAWRHAGRYGSATRSVEPFGGGFERWIADETRKWLEKSISYGTGATGKDRVWLQQILDEGVEALRVPCAPTLVLHDYREANATVESRDGRWRVSGLFDLMEAIFGDPELDLSRQLATYMDEDAALACAFLTGYQAERPLRADASRRLAMFMTYDRMIVWEFYHRIENIHLWRYPERTPREWMNHYLDRLRELLRRCGQVS